MTHLKDQYELVRQSRSVFLEYCKSISSADLTKENSSFGRGSIRNLLVHVANTYQFWIGIYGLKKELVITKYENINSIDDTVALFNTIDGLMLESLNYVEKSEINEIDGNKRSAKPLVFFTHVITHEFHHKGQILSLSRHLDYVPVDTDVMR